MSMPGTVQGVGERGQGGGGEEGVEGGRLKLWEELDTLGTIQLQALRKDQYNHWLSSLAQNPHWAQDWPC